MRAIAILSVLVLTACRTAGYKDDGTVQPFGGNNTYAITLGYVNGLGQRGYVDDYLAIANSKCSSMGLYMQPKHKGGDMFVFRCAAVPSDGNWRTDAGVVTVRTQ